MPLFALLDGERARAIKDGPRRAACLDCGAAMLAKTGEVVSWHWAHLTENPHCAAALESEWHLGWKSEATHPGVEVAVGKRRADVLAPYGYAIEFQRSALTREEVQAREDDWERKVIWIFYAKEAYERPGGLEFWNADASFGKVDWAKIHWPHAPERVRAARCWVLLDVGKANLMFVGEWVPGKSPLQGYGWTVSREWVEKEIINGNELPMRPGLTVPPWAPSQVKQRQLQAARTAERRRAQAAIAEADRVEREERGRQAERMRATANADVRHAYETLERGGLSVASTATLYAAPEANGYKWRPPHSRRFQCLRCGVQLYSTGALQGSAYRHRDCGGRFQRDPEPDAAKGG
jgi:hypothetical protein